MKLFLILYRPTTVDDWLEQEHQRCERDKAVVISYQQAQAERSYIKLNPLVIVVCLLLASAGSLYLWHELVR